MGLLNVIFPVKQSQIGTVTVDAAVSEKHSFASTPTRNPVEEGAKVTDHVELEPVRLSIQGMISDSPLDFQILNNIAKGDFKAIGKSFKDGLNNSLGKTSRSIEQFEALLQLQKSRQPFEVITGLKIYKDMILTSLDIDRTATTGKALHFTAEMEQIRIVSSQVIGKESLGKGVKNLASKTKNLGKKVTDKIEPAKEPKKTKGASALLEKIYGKK